MTVLRKFPAFLMAMFLVVLITGCSSGDETSQIYFGGDIITMSGQGDRSVEAVFVHNGKIIATGTRDEIMKKKLPGTRLVDLKGKTLLPGFIAIHTHPDLTAYFHGFVDLSGFTHSTPEQVWAALRKAVKETPRGQWIYCKGFDPMLVKGLKAPHISQLDEIAPENPLFIIAQSMHSAWANTLAFKETGITASTPNPAPGSWYEKDKQGKLTGFVSEVEAMQPFSDNAQKVFDIKKNMLGTFSDYMSNGYTSITTMGMFGKDTKPMLLYEKLSSRKPGMLVRILTFFGILPDVYPTVRHFMYSRYDKPFIAPDTVENGDDFFRVVGIKFWYDGSPYTGSMYLNEPYVDSPLMREGLNIPKGHRGAPVISKNIFYENIRKFHRQGWQISIHSQGDRSTRDVLDAIEKVVKESPRKDHRARIEHGVLYPPELIEKTRDLGVTVSFHINHLYYYGKALNQDIIGPERAGKMLPLKSVIDSGIHISLHADSPMYPEDPLSMLQTAVTRTTREGLVIGPGEKITVYDGLRALTTSAAWQLHMEKKLGSIEPGKYADFVVLQENPLKVDPGNLRNIKVIKTIVNGRVVWSHDGSPVYASGSQQVRP